MRTVTQIANGYEFATGQNKKVVVTHHAMERFRTRFASRFLPADWRGHDSWQVCAEKMFGMFVNADEMPHALRRVWMTWHDTPCRIREQSRNEAAAFVYRDDPDQRVILTCFAPVCRECREVWCHHVREFL